MRTIQKRRNEYGIGSAAEVPGRPGVWDLRLPRRVAGKQIKRRVRADDYAHAMRQLVSWERDVLEGRDPAQALVRSVGAGLVTVGGLLDRYLAAAQDRHGRPWTHETRRKADGKARNWVRPELGDKAVVDLTASHLDMLYAKMCTEGKSTGTIRQVHALIHSCLDQAMRWDMVDTNVADKATPPMVVPKRARHMPSTDEVRRMVDAADAIGQAEGMAFYLLATTGIRSGALCALRWSDVDLEAGTVWVERSINLQNGKRIEKAQKTRKVQLLGLTPTCIERLRAYRPADPGNAFLFTRRDGGSWEGNQVLKLVGRLADDCGIPHVTPHQLRHYVGSRLFEQGVDLPSVSAILGHSDSSVTARIYAHQLADQKVVVALLDI